MLTLSVSMLLHLMPLQMLRNFFCEALVDTAWLMNTDELLFILGDFNARVEIQWLHWPRA